jgi:hypothetical protein
MIRIALMSTADRSPDLTRMTDHLYTTLEQIEKVEVVRVDLLPGQPVVYGNYAYIVLIINIVILPFHVLFLYLFVVHYSMEISGCAYSFNISMTIALLTCLIFAS